MYFSIIRYWNGLNCDVYDASFPGGIGKDVSVSTTTEPMMHLKELCLEYGCPNKAGNGVCDKECDSYACNYDGKDCSMGIQPWENCTAIAKVSVQSYRCRGVSNHFYT